MCPCVCVWLCVRERNWGGKPAERERERVGRSQLLAVVVFVPPLRLMPGIVEPTFTAEGNLFDFLFDAETAD